MTIKHCSNCGAKLDEDNLMYESKVAKIGNLSLVDLPSGGFDLDFDERDEEGEGTLFYCGNCERTIEGMDYDDAIETLKANTPDPNDKREDNI